MGKHEKKAGKGRLDKFYWLAKEQGYRSRAAFKLVQLNKKYKFLENARCCIDLCAAPGGWLQVASKHMPPGSLIVGVDLVAIKPIPRCITFAEDINSFKCRDQLRETLKDWRADVVLHDGAPNVGTAWVQDAYTQSELTLQALKLAVEFLSPGGTFVTKVFRSKDYNNLMWVFNQLFHHVEATKPPSSRNVSAEIFVVCQNFRNLSRIDPKFLDPRYVFKELDSNTMQGTSSRNLLENVVNPEKYRRKREGYEDGNYTLYKTIGADEYIRSTDPIAVLGTYNRITFETKEDKSLLKHAATSEDVKANCEDLKVLGRRDFSVLIKWRKAVRESLELDRPRAKETEEAQATVEMEPLNEEEAIDEELSRLNEVAQKRARKERRKRNEARAKALQKLQLNMTTAMDIGEEWRDEALHGEDMFSLDAIEGRHAPGHARAAQLVDAEDAPEDEEMELGGHDEEDEDEDEDEDEKEARLRALESNVDAMYEQYKGHLEQKDAKFRAKEARRNSSKYEEWDGISSKNEDDDEDSDEGPVARGYDAMNKRKFHEETYDSDDAEDDDDEREDMASAPAPSTDTRKSKKVSMPNSALLTNLESPDAAETRQSAASAMWFDNPIFDEMIPLEDFAPASETARDATPALESASSHDEESSAHEDDDNDDEMGTYGDDIELVPSNTNEDIPDSEWNIHDDDIEATKQARIKQHGLQTAEAVSMAHALVNRQVTKTDLVNQGFNRHSFNDKAGLPEWFLEDENKHYRTNLPITKEAVEALRARQRALDARPIKKLAEAKARKKHRAAMRLEKAQKKAEAINENTDLSEREKAENISKILARSSKKTEKKAPQLVVARGPNRGIKGRPKGTKGRYKMVDARMKKELRAQKRRDKRDGKKRSSGHKRQIHKGY
ncbi:AdoMet-dependent rRNA methyltransferase spb1 [Malassezia nana]|uniref:AdoMet-dependent rRNA methyltransferase spb1 n=1 Tax=Malassezia nana TaxID=180528 RepID=A0AAF0J4F9_9BASI|nr:AdoMet-dependent rRNA methyltransferase spb1 [Malassezia nana]